VALSFYTFGVLVEHTVHHEAVNLVKLVAQLDGFVVVVTEQYHAALLQLQ